jgi:hypothetical protein
MRTLILSLLLAGLVGGCAYRRHTTPLHAVPNAHVKSDERPKGLYSFRLVDAVPPQRKISGLQWDDDGSGPDCFVRLFIDDRLVWESPVVEDSNHPEWNVMLPRNIVVRRSSHFRLELWDRDTAVSADPMGRIERQGIPAGAQPGALARLTLSSTAIVAVRFDDPIPYRGVGLSVELRPDGLKVLTVEPFSPAGRAGLKQGERIVGIGPERVAHMSDDQAASARSLASDRGREITVADVTGVERTVTLDKGFVWLVL